MHFLEIISADIVFKFCRYTHASINRGWGLRSHHLQRRTQGDQNAAIPPPPKRPKMAQNQHVPRYNNKTKQQENKATLFMKDGSTLLVRP